MDYHNLSFIIIDENSLDIMIVSKLIEMLYPQSEVHVFRSVKEATIFFRQANVWVKKTRNIVLLDLEMPCQNGWDFLNEFKQLSLDLQSLFQIYILSFSILPAHIKEAQNESIVAGFLHKPLTKKELNAIVENLKTI